MLPLLYFPPLLLPLLLPLLPLLHLSRPTSSSCTTRSCAKVARLIGRMSRSQATCGARLFSLTIGKWALAKAARRRTRVTGLLEAPYTLCPRPFACNLACVRIREASSPPQEVNTLVSSTERIFVVFYLLPSACLLVQLSARATLRELVSGCLRFHLSHIPARLCISSLTTAVPLVVSLPDSSQIPNSPAFHCIPSSETE